MDIKMGAGKQGKTEGKGDNMAGKLDLCADTHWNLEDITFRVLRTLKEVDLIAARTRSTASSSESF